MTEAVDQLPIPYWLFYLGLGAVLTSIAVAIQLASGSNQFYFPILSLMGGAIPFVLCGIHYLDHLAAEMLEKLRPALNTTDGEYALLRYRLITLPAREAWVASAAGMLIGIVLFITLPFQLQLQIWQMVDSPVSVLSVHLFTILNFVMAALGWYHTYHQLRVVSQIYAYSTTINFANVKPLYSFSVLSAQTAFAYVLYPYLLVAAVPLLLDLDFTRAVLVVNSLMVTLLFVWPLLGVHRQLEAEKDRLLLENAARSQRLTAELNQRIDSKDYKEIGDVKTAVESLELERERISRISTWPWKPETVRGLAATVVLPLLIWGIQWVFERLVAP